MNDHQDKWHALESREVISRLETDLANGLTSTDAVAKLARFGPNELTAKKAISRFSIFLDQFRNVLIIILLGAAGLSLGHWILLKEEPYPFDFIIILFIVILNAVMGFVQEYKAEQAMEALREMSAPEARVLRDGAVITIDARDVVPGDIFLVEAGDKLTADLRIVSDVDLYSDESLLTGESLPSLKGSKELAPGTSMADRSNILFSGTVVTAGRGKAVAVATGMASEMGKIAEMIKESKQEQTPLQKEMDKLGKSLGKIILIITLVTIGVALLVQETYTVNSVLSLLLFGVALAVAAIPEGLPAIVTISLALGVKRMASKKAIVRKLSAVETLGSTSIICSDKTGTITMNRLKVTDVMLACQIVECGDGEVENAKVEGAEIADELILDCAVLCNNASELGAGADPVETALVKHAEEKGRKILEVLGGNPRIGELPFSSEKKFMLTAHSSVAGGKSGYSVFAKGAPEVLLGFCRSIAPAGDIDQQERELIQKKIIDLADNGLKVLGFAAMWISEEEVLKNISDKPGADRIKDSGTADETEKDQFIGEHLIDVAARQIEQGRSGLKFIGLMGMMDPPREEVHAAVEICYKAGIAVTMITGDHKETAVAIAKQIGIFREGDIAINGPDLTEMTDEELSRVIDRVRVFSRVEPEQKLRIVELLQQNGQIVAMTGDGVNDAPALKRANIGIAMGISGTDVSREASDMILTDDNFATIVTAVEEGRKIFNNIRRFITFLFSTNSGEVLTLFFGVMLASALGLIEGGIILVPLLAIHILWVNIMTDGAPALALGVEPADPDIMLNQPRRHGEPIVRKDMWRAIAMIGTIMAIATLFVLDLFTPGGMIKNEGGTIEHARTAAFTLLVLFQLFDALNWRSYPKSIFKVPFFRNKWLIGALGLSVVLQLVIIYFPPLTEAFEATPLTGPDWLIIVGLASLVIVAMELYKLTLRSRF